MKRRRIVIICLFLMFSSILTINLHNDSIKIVEAATNIKAPSIINNGYDGVFYKITMSADKNSTIYYTIDGSAPTNKSVTYKKAIILEAGKKYTIKAIAYKGSQKSTIISRTYNQKLTMLGKKVKQIVSDNIKNDMSDINKVLSIITYFNQNIKYDVETLNGSRSHPDAFRAEGALIDNLAVCDGYSKGFLLLMDRLGITCKRITGIGSWGGSSGNHAWNMVKLEGKWYHIEPQGRDLLLSDKEFRKIGYSWTATSYPKCDSNYFDKTFTYDKYSMFSQIDFDIRSNLKHIKFSKDIKEIPEDFFSYCNIESVEIPGSVRIIRKNAFANNTKLKTVILEDGVVEIEDYAFSNCTNLKEITIPQSITDIGTSVFDQTPWFNSQKDDFVIIGDGILIKCNLNDYNNVIFPSNVKVITGAFKDNESLTNIVIPNTVIKILDGAFRNTSLQSIIIPDSVTVIGDSVFESCGILTEIKFSSNLKTIGEYTFSECRNLSEVILHEGLKEIGHGAFNNCYSLENIVLPKSLIKVSNSFYDTPWIDKFTDEFVIINNSILLFYNGSASEVQIPDNVKSIAPFAFYDNETIKKIVLSDIDEVLDYTFWYCKKLETIHIPKSVTEIGRYAFGFTNLENITIPGSVKIIHNNAFDYCYNLKKVILKSGVEEIGEDVFRYTALTEITIPASVKSIGYGIFPDDKFCKDMIVYCKKDSYAYKHIIEYGTTIKLY